MANTLVFPDGVRLLDVDKDDLPAELKRAEIDPKRNLSTLPIIIIIALSCGGSPLD